MTDKPIRRRDLLASTAFLASLAGCSLGDDDDESTPESTETAPPESDSSTATPGSTESTDAPGTEPPASDTATASDTETATDTATATDAEPASVSIASPADGTTVHGSVVVQVEAGETGGDGSVDVAVGDGSWQSATHDSSSDYYEYEWDTSDLAQGEYTLDARINDADGNTTEAESVTVTVYTVLEGFEGANPLQAYGVNASSFSVVESPVYDGDQALSNFEDALSLVSTAGLDYYPKRYDDARLYFKNASDDNFVAFHFFAQSETDNPRGYTAGISSSSALKLWRKDSEGTAVIGEDPLPAAEQISEWYRLELYSDSDTLYVSLYDDAEDAELAAIEVDDDTFTQGGIGFRSLGNGEVWDGLSGTTSTSSFNQPPKCSIASPVETATVEESVAVQVDVTDNEDNNNTLAVDVAVNDGDWQTAAYDSATGYYEYELDTAAVEGDEYTLYARATDSEGKATSADPVTVFSPSETTDPGDFEPGIRHSLYDGPVGGGDGMPSDAVPSKDEADVVVSNGDLQGAIDSASRGDVIYVEGSATATAVTQDEITIAGNRGEGDDGHINDPDIEATNVTFDGLTVDVADSIVVTERGWECFNCDISGAGYLDIDQDQLTEPAIEFKQCEIHDLETYKSIQCGYMRGSDVDACGNSWHMPGYENRVRIVYCEWHNNSKIAGTQFYFEAIDNHLKDTATSGAFIEIRAANECRVTGSGSVNGCGSPCGTAVIEHNLNEMVNDADQVGVRLLQSRGRPWRETAAVRRNEAPVNKDWDAGCEASDTFEHAQFRDQIALQNAGGEGKDTLDNIVVENNELGQ